jgi:hypothetical protein
VYSLKPFRSALRDAVKNLSGSLYLIAVLLAGSFAGWNTASAEALNLDFGSGSFSVGGIRVPSNTFGAASGQTGAWNAISAFSTPSGVVDVSGSSTSVAINIAAVTMGGYMTTTGFPLDPTALVEDNFYGYSWTVSITGLHNGLYDVYLYEPNHPDVGTGAGTVNGVAFGNINGNFSGTFLLGSNYHRLSGVLVSGGQLLASVTSGAVPVYGGLAGMQLVPAPVPEPETYAMMLAGLGLLGFASRRRKHQAA